MKTKYAWREHPSCAGLWRSECGSVEKVYGSELWEWWFHISTGARLSCCASSLEDAIADCECHADLMNRHLPLD